LRNRFGGMAKPFRSNKSLQRKLSSKHFQTICDSRLSDISRMRLSAQSNDHGNGISPIGKSFISAGNET
jgi:hypothetical protein